jgi:Ca-activated chloride channel homolog
VRFRVLAPLFSLISSLTAYPQIVTTAGVEGSEFIAPATTITKAVDEVNLAFTVTDKRGRFISNLGPNDFHLLDNHQAPVRLTFFQQRSDLPLHLALLIDASASVEYRFKFEVEAAAAFLKGILRPGKDQALIIAFNDQVKILAEPTDRAEKLSAALKKIKPSGNTALHDAVIYASEQLRRLPEKQITRRAIVLISDGVDTVNRSTLQHAEQSVSRTQVMLFSLSTNFSESDANASGDEVLRELATSTGGALMGAHDQNRLTSAFRTVQKALRSQYVLAYNPAGFTPDGSYRQIELNAIKRGLHTNCRRGYYAKIAAKP